MKLFAVHRGGKHPRGNIELHDVVDGHRVCLEKTTAVDGYSLLLKPADQKSELIYHSGYLKIPR